MTNAPSANPTTPPSVPPIPRPRRRRWPWVLAILLLLLLTLAGVFYYFTRPVPLARLIARIIASQTGAAVQIDTAHFQWRGKIELSRLVLREPTLPDAGNLLFVSKRVIVQHNPWSLLRFKFQAKSLVFDQPILYLTEDLATGKFNYQVLQERRTDTPGGEPLKDLPEFFLSRGQAQFGAMEAGKYIPRGAVNLSGQFVAKSDREGLYQFELRQETDPSLELPEGFAPVVTAGRWVVLRGEYDLRRNALIAELEGFALESPLRNALPRRIQQWWDRLQPSGSLGLVRFGYDPDPAAGFTASFQLRDTAITLPYGDLHPRLSGVSGQFVIVNDHIRVSDLIGRAEDIPFVLSGEIRGLDLDAPLKLMVKAGPFDIPEQPAYLPRLPKFVRNQFDRFAPSGRFQAMVFVQRTEPGSKLAYQGTIDVLDARGHYAKFPYPLEQVRGQILFDPKEVKVVSLHGRGPTGAKAVIRGTITSPGDGAGVDFHVTVTDLPLDQQIRLALSEKRRKIIDMFLDQAAYQRLLDAGLIQTSQDQQIRQARLDQLLAQRRAALEPQTQPAATQPAGELDAAIAATQQELQRPVFDLGGQATLQIAIKRPQGPGQAYTVTTTLDIPGGGIVFSPWPYPLRIKAGQIVINPDDVVIQGVDAEGLTGAFGRVSGTMDLPKGQDVRPHLKVLAVNAPIDELLLASIPKPQDKWVRDLHLAGRLDAGGEIFRDDQRDTIDYRIQIQLHDGQATPYAGRYNLQDLAGQLTLFRRRVDIDQIQGRHGQTQVSLKGQALWGKEDRLDLNLSANHMRFEEPVLDLMPPDQDDVQQVRDLFARHNPAGIFDADVDLQIQSDRDPDYQLRIRPATLAFDLRGHRIALRDIKGSLDVNPNGLALRDCQAAFEGGKVSGNGTVGFGAQPNVNLRFEATAARMDATTRAILPRGVLRVLDGLEVDGAYYMHDATLTWRPDASNRLGLNLRGDVDLTNAKAMVGVPITHMNGRMRLEVSHLAGDEWPRLDLNLSATDLRAADRLISPLSVHIATTRQVDLLAIDRLDGKVYGGVITGTGVIQLGGAYRLQLSLQDVALDPFLAPEKSASVPPGGFLSAGLDIEGLPEKPESRRGRGKLMVRDANLYNWPLSMALLQVVNLAWPSAKSFDRATAQYLIEGDLVHFDTVSFESPSVAITGGGSMRYSDYALDLNLYSRNPAGPRLGPVSDMVKLFKDELLSIRVTGTLTEPKTSVQSFSGVRNSWNQVFGTSPQPKPAAPTPLPNSNDASSRLPAGQTSTGTPLIPVVTAPAQPTFRQSPATQPANP